MWSEFHGALILLHIQTKKSRSQMTPATVEEKINLQPGEETAASIAMTVDVSMASVFKSDVAFIAS
ncbi:MAG: hypothetical protein CR997_10950 [Acidobacteria bacterium]|nr:MAG: hypothetical protein CR997_10950 [Acidobacteriota bacterium]